MQGAYQFKFGPKTVSLRQKLDKIAGEPIAFYLYKRRDFKEKIDKLEIGQLRLARLIFQVATSARKEYEFNMEQKRQLEAEARARERQRLKANSSSADSSSEKSKKKSDRVYTTAGATAALLGEHLDGQNAF